MSDTDVEWQISYYRLYVLSRRSGEIQRFEEFEAPDDAAALEIAQRSEGENPIELWCRARKVARIDAIGVSVT